MGKQTAVALTDDVEVEFLRYLRSIADIQLIESFATVAPELFVSDFAARQGHWNYLIWNKAFAWSPEFARTRSDLPDQSRRNLYYVSNASAAPLVQYTRHNFDGDAPTGRLYWAKSFAAPRGLSYDTTAFDSWFQLVVRWARHHAVRSS